MAAEQKRMGFFLRHSAVVRTAHWINAVCLVFLLMSGLNIFNAHPALYFGSTSTFDHPAFSIDSKNGQSGPIGFVSFGGRTFTTTGLLGVSEEDGQPQERAFPSWLTIPAEYDLATARRWHFLFAWIFVLNGLVYLGYGLASGHIRRDLIPRFGDFKRLGPTVWEHLRLKFPHGEEAKRYNILQMMAYFAVACMLLPLMALAGWSMSPGIDAAAPFLPELFGGRQSARTVHFIGAWLLVLFFVVHVLMVVLSGLWNNIRSMITGWYRLEP